MLQTGVYLLKLVENSGWSLLMIAFVECLVVGWVYGSEHLLDDMQWMYRQYPLGYFVWLCLWRFVCPAILMVVQQKVGVRVQVAIVTIWCCVLPDGIIYNQLPYPQWANYIFISLPFVLLAPIPLTIVVQMIITRGSFSQRTEQLLNPTMDWGPALAVFRAEKYPLQIPEAKKPVRQQSWWSTSNQS